MMELGELKKDWANLGQPFAFGGEDIFLKYNPQLNRNILRKELLPSLITYQKFRAAKPTKIVNPYFVRKRRKVIQSDLVFMTNPPNLPQKNKGYKYILIVQDIFSRKIWTAPLKKKNASSVLIELKKIINKMRPFHPEARFVIDRGTEYLNASVLSFLQQNNISVSHPSDGHASHVERANLSLQRLLFQSMTEAGKQIWYSKLKDAEQTMNDRHHRIIKMSPNVAELPINESKVNEAMSLYRHKALVKENKKLRKKPPKFSIGDKVRIKKEKRVFSRGYHPTFTSEIFKIVKVLDHLPITMYTISEWDGTEIQGNFYPEELSLVLGDVFKVERIIKRATVRRRKKVFVKWEGFSSKYNSWINESDLIRS